jgi:hypothetical protein
VPQTPVLQHGRNSLSRSNASTTSQEFIKLRQFQIIQTDFDNIEIKYVPEGAPEPVQFPALTRRVRAILGQPVNVTVRAVDKIERTATGKYEDCISVVPSA